MISITGSAFQGKTPRVVNITIPVVNIIILRKYALIHFVIKWHLCYRASVDFYINSIFIIC